MYVLADACAQADERAVADAYPTGQLSARGNVNVVSNDAIVFNVWRRS